MGTLTKASIILFALSVAACDTSPRWNAFVYPDATLDKWETLGPFHDFEECQSAAISRMRELPEPQRASYECGYKCEWRADLQVNVCKETRD